MQMRTILLLLIIAMPCWAQSTPARASYRISLTDGTAGSATGISPHYAVTNAHVGRAVKRRAVLRNPVTGVKATGEVVCLYREADLALVRTDQKIDWVYPSATGIDASKPINRYSYGGGAGKLVRVACKLLHRQSRSRQGNVQYVETSVPSRSGDSGGGMFQDGKLVAVLWGTGAADTIGAETPYLHGLCKHYDKRAGTQLAGLFCRPGQSCPPSQGSGRVPIGPLDLGPTPQPSPAPAPAPAQIDLDDLASRIAKLIPRPKDGRDGKDGRAGKDGQPGASGIRGLQGTAGRGVESLQVLSGGVLLVQYTDGQTQEIPGLGVTFELYDEAGDRVDSEFIPLGGTLKLQQYVRGAK